MALLPKSYWGNSDRNRLRLFSSATCNGLWLSIGMYLDCRLSSSLQDGRSFQRKDQLYLSTQARDPSSLKMMMSGRVGAGGALLSRIWMNSTNAWSRRTCHVSRSLKRCLVLGSHSTEIQTACRYPLAKKGVPPDHIQSARYVLTIPGRYPESDHVRTIEDGQNISKGLFLRKTREDGQIYV